MPGQGSSRGVDDAVAGAGGSVSNILELPEELLVRVLGAVPDVVTVMRLAATCHLLAQVATTDSLWHDRLQVFQFKIFSPIHTCSHVWCVCIGMHICLPFNLFVCLSTCIVEYMSYACVCAYICVYACHFLIDCLSGLSVSVCLYVYVHVCMCLFIHVWMYLCAG